MVVPVEVALGLLVGEEPYPRHHLSVPHHLKQRLGVGILRHLLVLVRLLVRRFCPPKLSQPQNSHRETRRPHSSKLLGSARDPRVGDAPQDRARRVRVVAVAEGLGRPGVLPVLRNRGGDHGGGGHRAWL